MCPFVWTLALLIPPPWALFIWFPWGCIVYRWIRFDGSLDGRFIASMMRIKMPWTRNVYSKICRHLGNDLKSAFDTGSKNGNHKVPKLFPVAMQNKTRVLVHLATTGRLSRRISTMYRFVFHRTFTPSDNAFSSPYYLSINRNGTRL